MDKLLPLLLFTSSCAATAEQAHPYEEPLNKNRAVPEVEPEFTEPISNVTVPLGRDAQLPCVVDNLGSYRAAWIKVESKAILTIHHHIITRNYRISLSHSDNRNFILHIRNVQMTDRGAYMCQLNTVPMKSQVGYLDVLVPPDIIVAESSSDVIAREGTNVSLSCKAKGYPAPNISWRREDNEAIPLGMRQATTYEGEQLNITRVSRLHMGAYLCIASNGVPPSVSRRIILHVHFPPVMWIPNQLVGAAMGKDVTLDCHTEAYPVSINYWAKDGGDMIIPNEKFETAIKDKTYKIHMKLTVKTLEEEDFGTYKCFAENSLGSTEGSIRMYEIPPPTEEPTKQTIPNIRVTPEDLTAFPRHQSFGSVKDSESESTEVKNSLSIPTDGKYRSSEDASALEDRVPLPEKSRKGQRGQQHSKSTSPCPVASSYLKFVVLLMLQASDYLIT